MLLPVQQVSGRPTAAASLAKSTAQRGQAQQCQAATVQFSKFQGLGNDFILVQLSPKLPVLLPQQQPEPCALQVDNRHQREPAVTPDQAAKLCDRNFGVGGDGVSVHFEQQLSSRPGV